MSISDEIKNRIGEGRLHELAPALPGSPTARRVIASTDIAGLVMGPWNDAAWEERCNQLRADIDRFITGALITVAREPFRGKTAYLRQLHPPRDEAWEIRSRDPKPAVRVLGRFAGRDIFVALAWHKRADLGGPASKSWRDAIESCKADWRNLFPAYEPVKGNTTGNYDAYVSKYILV